MEQPKLQGRKPDLVPPAQITKLVAMFLCAGEPSQVIEVPVTILKIVCHLMFNAKDIFPSAVGTDGS